MIAIWDNRLSSGNSIIDAEHRLVLDLLNELDVAFAVGAPDEVVERALDALVRGIGRHFARDGQSPSGRVAEHAAIAACAHRLLHDWRAGTARAIDRRTLLNLSRRWIDHMGRRETRVPQPTSPDVTFSPALAS
ncbi:hypothetical protein [Magnetospirillum sp. SS-4]|uniref:hypothetical protein n=1 Tax=Magnetospirillum sp. SS-4 TaxID=2681465 RepID=UPI001381FECA|nr:hypothetical protein [Magnetospirillum sp. SS-4]CAA7612425.1 conserved hypothetical protein [Magnetospirillum sp. SS-4]